MEEDCRRLEVAESEKGSREFQMWKRVAGV